MTLPPVDESIDLAIAEAEPYVTLPPSVALRVADKVKVAGGKGRVRYYLPWPPPEPDPSMSPEERLALRHESLLARPDKLRAGGFHPDILPGEVGPCTRCGWVWYPTYKTLLQHDYPHRCSYCRSPDSRIPPK